MKRKGFTLVELLVVIVIIGLLAVLLIPKVKSTIEDSRKSSHELSAQALSRTAENYYLEKKAGRDNKDCSYDFTSNINTCEGFEFSGEKPESGRLEITKNGNVMLAVQFENKCYIKTNESELEIIDYNSNTCGTNAYVFLKHGIPSTVASGDGLYAQEDGRYIYRGTNPSNYVKIKENGSNVLYRIISFEPDGTIKVVRKDSIGRKPWDERTSETTGHRKNEQNSYCNYTGTYYGCNAWGNQDNTYFEGNLLASISNSFYYKYYSSNVADTLNQNRTGETVKVNSTLNTYLNGAWLTSVQLDDYIVEHSFDVGGIYYYGGYTGGDKGLEKEKYEQGLNTWNGKVGLFNITEMVDSSLNPSCTSVYSNYYGNIEYYYKDEGSDTYTQHNTTNNWPCKYNNWLFRNITEWSLSPNSYDRGLVWYVVSLAGYFSGDSAASNSFGVRPVFYLKSSIQYHGLGTELDPYEIFLD